MCNAERKQIMQLPVFLCRPPRPPRPHLKFAFLPPSVVFCLVLFLRTRQWSVAAADVIVLTQLRCIKQSVVPAFYLAPGCFYGRAGGVGGGGCTSETHTAFSSSMSPRQPLKEQKVSASFCLCQLCPTSVFNLQLFPQNVLLCWLSVFNLRNQKFKGLKKAVSRAALARALICSADPRVSRLGVWMNTSSELTKTISVVLSAVRWAVLVVLWERRVQLEFLWCGRNWFESVPRAVQMLRSVLLMKTVVCPFTDHRVLVVMCCEYLKRLFLTLSTCSIPLSFIILTFFAFWHDHCHPPPTPAHWQEWHTF